MEIHTLTPSSTADRAVAILPGRTLQAIHAADSAARAARRADASEGKTVAPAVSPTAPGGQHRALELVEDAFLLLLIVFAVPAVILLLAAPFAVLFRLAAIVGARW